MNGIWITLLLGWCATGAAVGAILGLRKNRLLRGVALGLVLGPVGWAIIALGSADLRDCPGCSRAISTQARVCPHCGVDLRRELSRSSRSQLRRKAGRGPW